MLLKFNSFQLTSVCQVLSSKYYMTQYFNWLYQIGLCYTCHIVFEELKDQVAPVYITIIKR